MDGGYAPRLTGPVSSRISNLDTDLSRLSIGDHDLPMTRNDGLRATNYLCCPSAAYLDYARDELRHFCAHPALKGALRGLIAAAAPLMRASGLDRQVQPNNWLLSTNILPDLAQSDIVAATRELTRQWPDHAIVWRSVNDRATAKLKQRFEAAGYHALASRQVWLFDCREAAPPVGRDAARDNRLLARGDYTVANGPWTAEDFDRMAQLYGQLYLDKYSPLNPAYSADFFAAADREGWLEFQALRNGEGRLDGMIACFERGDTLTAPAVGYDTNLPVETGLYRRLMALAMQRARARHRLYNMSAGAGGFKRNRGAVPALEYMMVYDRHLPAGKRLAGAAVRALVNHVGIPVLQRFSL